MHMCESCRVLGWVARDFFWSFSGFKTSREAPGSSAPGGTTGSVYLYVAVSICIVLACFQLGSWGRQKIKSNHTRVSHRKA